MTNALCVLLYAPLFLIMVILLVTTLRSGLRNRTVRRSLGLYGCLAAWLLCEIIFYSAGNPEVMQDIVMVALSFRGFGAVFMLLMLAGFYRIDRNVPQRYILLWFLPAAVQTVFCVLPPLQRFLIKEFTVVSLAPLKEVVMKGTVYFYVQILYNQLLVAAVILLVLVSFSKLPRGYRSGSQFLVIGFAAYMFGSVAELALWRQFPLNLVLVGASICGIMLYYTMLVSGRYDYLHIERREVFHYLDEGVFILDEKGIILDANLTAQRLFRLAEIKYQQQSFDELLDEMVKSGRIIRQQQEDEPGEYLCFLDNKLPLFYQMQRQPVSGRDLADGKCIVLTDRTNSRLFMERLKETAGEDALTGLPNRYRYQEVLRHMDSAENLPLSIIIGDVNGLKLVNDTQGHFMGDTLLRNIAVILRDCCPEDGFLARIGGDEFVLLLPRCPQIAARAVVDEVGRTLAESKSTPRPSMALGSATKTASAQNINTLINEADREMYDDKRAPRR